MTDEPIQQQPIPASPAEPDAVVDPSKSGAAPSGDPTSTTAAAPSSAAEAVAAKDEPPAAAPPPSGDQEAAAAGADAAASESPRREKSGGLPELSSKPRWLVADAEEERLAALPVEEPVEEPAAPPAEVPPAEAAKKPKPRRKKAEKKDEAVADAAPAEKSDKLNWYILKVASNREDSIREGLQRRVRIAGLDKYFADIIVPIETVMEVKGGKKRQVKRKLYPGYLVVHMEINEETWFLVRETPGIGDFTGGAGHPSPMLESEVKRILQSDQKASGEGPVVVKIPFKQGDRVKINEGTFENFEGEVDKIDQTNGRVTVMINIFGRSTPVELEYWQVESL